jgi:hypothetical protein
MSTLLTDLIRNRLAAISVATGMGAEALDGASVDLPPHIQGELLTELDTLAGRLDLCLARLANAVDPARVKPDPAELEATVGHRD